MNETQTVHNMARPEGFTRIEYTPQLKQQFSEMFSDEFMQKHTNFRNFTAFQYSSAVICNWNAPELIYYESLMDSFVRESTEYDSWEQMVCSAADERYTRPAKA